MQGSDLRHLHPGNTQNASFLTVEHWSSLCLLLNIYYSHGGNLMNACSKFIHIPEQRAWKPLKHTPVPEMKFLLRLSTLVCRTSLMRHFSFLPLSTPLDSFPGGNYITIAIFNLPRPESCLWRELKMCKGLTIIQWKKKHHQQPQT